MIIHTSSQRRGSLGGRFLAICVGIWASCLVTNIAFGAEPEPTVIKGELLVFYKPDLKPYKLTGEHQPKAPSARPMPTVVLPEMTIKGDRVQTLPRGAHIPCARGRGVIEHGATDKHGTVLPSRARCI